MREYCEGTLGFQKHRNSTGLEISVHHRSLTGFSSTHQKDLKVGHCLYMDGMILPRKSSDLVRILLAILYFTDQLFWHFTDFSVK